MQYVIFVAGVFGACVGGWYRRGHGAGFSVCGTDHGAWAFPRPRQGGEILDTKFVQHEFRVMARKLRNVTVTLDEETARWARLEAARRDTSVSRLLGEILRERMADEAAYASARARYLAQAPGMHREPDRPLPTRDELHDRRGLR